MTTDYINELENIKRNAAQTNKPLLNWWLCILFGILTFGVLFIALFVNRVKRLNNFIDTRAQYYQTVTKFTREYCASERAKCSANDRSLYNLNLHTQSFLSYNPKIEPTKTLFLFVITGGLYFIYYIFLMNKAWVILQYYEANYNKLLSITWIESGLVEEPIIYKVVNEPKHRFLTKLLFSVLTVGAYLIYWDYQVHVEPDPLFEKFDETFNTVENVIRQNTQK